MNEPVLKLYQIELKKITKYRDQPIFGTYCMFAYDEDLVKTYVNDISAKYGKKYGYVYTIVSIKEVKPQVGKLLEGIMES